MGVCSRTGLIPSISQMQNSSGIDNGKRINILETHKDHTIINENIDEDDDVKSCFISGYEIKDSIHISNAKIITWCPYILMVLLTTFVGAGRAKRAVTCGPALLDTRLGGDGA